MKRTIVIIMLLGVTTAFSVPARKPDPSGAKVDTESKANNLLTQAGAKGNKRFPNRAQDRTTTASFFQLGTDVVDFGKKGDRVWQIHYVTFSDMVIRIAWVNAESGALRLILPERTEENTPNK